MKIWSAVIYGHTAHKVERDEHVTILSRESEREVILQAHAYLYGEGWEIPYVPDDDSLFDTWLTALEDVFGIHVSIDVHHLSEPSLVVAEIDTRNFSFQAVGADAHEARLALAAGWAEHVRQYVGADGLYLNRSADEINIRTIEPGKCYRDGEEIHHD